MSHQSTPKTAAFRSLVQKAVTLHSEICTLDAAIRERDAIKARMGDCRDEAEARNHLATLMRAEETVIVKQTREPRQQAELAELLTQTEEAFHAANSELTQIIDDTPKQAMAAFRDLLVAAQLDPEERKVEQANPVVVNAIRPRALVSEQEDRLHEACRSVVWAMEPLTKRVEGFKRVLMWFDKVLAAQTEIEAECKRMVSACEAFRKVLAKG
jgi:hypothetical protein